SGGCHETAPPCARRPPRPPAHRAQSSARSTCPALQRIRASSAETAGSGIQACCAANRLEKSRAAAFEKSSATGEQHLEAQSYSQPACVGCRCVIGTKLCVA